MHRTRTKSIVALMAIVILIGAVAAGRHLLAGSAPPVAGPQATAASATATPARGPQAAAPPRNSPDGASTGAAVHGSNGVTGAKSPSSTDSAGLADVPVFPVTPQVVHTATVRLRVGKGKLDSALQVLANLAGQDGGYVDGSSLSGGTARTSPSTATITFRVPAADFASAIAKVATLGTVNDQRLTGKDVTVGVAKNAASIAVLQDEVNLLQSKLGQATDINTFLQIEGQLFPVEQQLQTLESSQAVLENSAALATVTVDLTAPGALLVTRPAPSTSSDAATVAWHYLRHNTLAVLDGLAVVGGWALPVLILLALIGLVVLWVIRRRRHIITPA